MKITTNSRVDALEAKVNALNVVLMQIIASLPEHQRQTLLAILRSAE